MPSATYIGAHQRYLDIWQQALESEKGIRIKTDNPVDFRMRMYHARAADRRNNARIYPSDNVMSGKSYYDDLRIKLEEGAIRVEPGNLNIEEIEAL